MRKLTVHLMSWERRRGRSYYYLARREGPRVVKQYVGRGEAAQAAADEIAARRQERREGRERQRRAEAERSALTHDWDRYWAMSAKLVNRMLAQ